MKKIKLRAPDAASLMSDAFEDFFEEMSNQTDDMQELFSDLEGEIMDVVAAPPGFADPKEGDVAIEVMDDIADARKDFRKNVESFLDEMRDDIGAKYARKIEGLNL